MIKADGTFTQNLSGVLQNVRIRFNRLFQAGYRDHHFILGGYLAGLQLADERVVGDGPQAFMQEPAGRVAKGDRLPDEQLILVFEVFGSEELVYLCWFYTGIFVLLQLAGTFTSRGIDYRCITK